jgi:hypothetical protein
MSYPMTSVSQTEYVMRYVPPPPPPPPIVDISITFNKTFRWDGLEKDVIANALETLINSPTFMKRFPDGIHQLNIQVITTLHKDKAQDRCDHINCRFFWLKPNGENNRETEKVNVCHLYFNENHSKIWQISETKYFNERF